MTLGLESIESDKAVSTNIARTGRNFIKIANAIDGGSNIDIKIGEHNTSGTAHADIRGQIENLEPKQWMPKNWKAETDFSSAYPNNSITYFQITTAWNGGKIYSSSIIKTTKSAENGIAKQEVFRSNGLPLYYRMADTTIAGLPWGEWVSILTSKKIQVNSLPFASGVVDFIGFGQRTRYIKDSNGKVTINCYCQFSNTNKITFGGGLLIATMPIGFRTNMAISDSGSVILYGDAAVTATIPVTITILPNGDIYMGAFDYTGTNHILMFTLVYYSEV